MLSPTLSLAVPPSRLVPLVSLGRARTILSREITNMIGSIYSDPVGIGFASGVTRGGQKSLEGGKTIVDTSNRFRVVTDVGHDDFVQLGRPLDAT